MKNSILFSVSLAIFLFTGSFAFAQDIPVKPKPLPHKFIDCEKENGNFVHLFKNRFCYDTCRYKTKELALAAHKEILRKNYLGCNSCEQMPPTFRCTTKILHFASGDLKLTPDKTQWCSDRNINLTFSCSTCSEKKPIVPFSGSDPSSFTGEMPNDEFAQREKNGATVEDHQEQSVSRQGALIDQQWRIFPNPTSDQVEIEVNTMEAVQEVRLIARNIAGQIVYEEDYGAAEKGLFKSSANLSNLANGWYMLSVYLDDELLGTEKIAISK